MKCERCGESDATVHWTESVTGVVIERHLCEACRRNELPGQLPEEEVLRFECRCGRAISWKFPKGGCGDPASGFKLTGRTKLDIDTCSCGIRFVAVALEWKCGVCGATSIVQPRESGKRGYLHDHIYGLRRAVEIRIRGIIPD